MKYILASIIIMTSTIVFAANAAGIPAVFHGNWAETVADCDPKGPRADLILVIKKSEYYGYEYGCKVTKILTSTALGLNAVAACSAEGNSSTGKIKWNLLDEGNVLKTDNGNGSVKYVRCTRR